ncbi:MAG TPA: hypothetical protein VFZ58_03570 [Candidatus Saccharimonadales bacterium]
MQQEEAIGTFYFSPRQRELIWLVAGSLVAGLLIPVASYALATLFIQPVFCKVPSVGVCSDVPTLGYNITLCLMSIVLLMIAVREQIFRPALVVLPHIIILWSLPAILPSVVQNLAGFSFLHAAASVLLLTVFYWLVRIRTFAIVLLLWVVLAVMARWILIS